MRETIRFWVAGIGLICAVVLSSASGQTPQGRFYLGADVSALAGRGGGGRGRGAAFPGYQENGQPGTEFGIMSRHGWNAFRLRVFVSPVRQAPNNSLENTVELAKQIKAIGATFMLDIHYSDTWADPQHQETPVAWRNLDIAGLESKVEEYSKDVIAQLKAAGAMPEMVQVGNEITGGMLWPTGHVKVPESIVKGNAEAIRFPLPQPYDDARQWDNLTRLIKAGIRGVKAGAGSTPPQIILHIDCGGDWPITQWWFDHITDAKVEYDIIGQSFYPNYHGTLAMLQENLIETAKRYKRPIMVVETGYPQRGGEEMMSPPGATPASGETAKAKGYLQWPGTPQGQLQFTVDLINTVKRNGGVGVFWWAPEGLGRDGMWNADGSPSPSIFALEHLQTLTTRPASRIPDATKP